VTYDGMPFTILSSDIRECRYGSIRAKTKEVNILFYIIISHSQGKTFFVSVSVYLLVYVSHCLAALHLR